MTYRQACKLVRKAGFAIKDGLGFTLHGGHLTNGDEASPRLAAMNGWAVEHIAAELADKHEET